MRKHTLHPLVYVLLTWTTIISIIQVVFITFFFTAGQNNQQDSTNEPRLGKGKMVTFKARQDNKKISWLSTDQDTSLIFWDDSSFKVGLDGYYFLNLQVTLMLDDMSENTGNLNHKVTLKLDEKVLLEGEIKKGAKSTGLLGKVEVLSAGGQLEVSIQPPTEIDSNESRTHFDIIFMDMP